MNKVLITGLNGALAKSTSIVLKKHGYDIVYYTTNKNDVNNKNIFYWNPSENVIDENALIDCSHIIHLSGFSIIKPWTKRNKKLMYESRVVASNLLFDCCNKNNIKIKNFITASAMGYYGLKVKGIKNESDISTSEWISKMAYDWEKASCQFKELNAKVVQLRISLLIDKASGYLNTLLQFLKFGFAPVFGSGKNIFEWIHIVDLSNFIKFALENKNVVGPYNMATEKKITQLFFIKKIKTKFSRLSLLFFVPTIMLKILMGSKSNILKSNLSLSVKKLKSTGFKFKYPTVDSI